MPSFHIKEAGNYYCEEKQLRKEKVGTEAFSNPQRGQRSPSVSPY